MPAGGRFTTLRPGETARPFGARPLPQIRLVSEYEEAEREAELEREIEEREREASEMEIEIEVEIEF